MGETPLCLALKVSFRVAREEIVTYIFVCVLTWSNKDLATSRSVSFRGLIQTVRRQFPPFSYASLPLGVGAVIAQCLRVVKTGVLNMRKMRNKPTALNAKAR